MFSILENVEIMFKQMFLLKTTAEIMFLSYAQNI